QDAAGAPGHLRRAGAPVWGAAVPPDPPAHRVRATDPRAVRRPDPGREPGLLGGGFRRAVGGGRPPGHGIGPAGIAAALPPDGGGLAAAGGAAERRVLAAAGPSAGLSDPRRADLRGGPAGPGPALGDGG